MADPPQAVVWAALGPSASSGSPSLSCCGAGRSRASGFQVERGPQGVAITPLETFSLVGSHGRGTWTLHPAQRGGPGSRSDSVGIPTRGGEPTRAMTHATT